MKRIFTIILTISTLLLLNVPGLAPHASAVPMTSHEMGGMNHQTGSSTSCAALCRTAVLTKEEAVDRIDQEENDPPLVPYYTQLQTDTSDDAEANAKLYAADVKPPSKIPIYILYGVLRI